MSADLLALLQDPVRVSEIPDQELPGLLLKVTGLLAALSSTTGALFCAAPGSEAPVQGEDHLLTVPEVADLLNVPKGYVYELTRRGQLPTIRFGKYVRVSRLDLQDWAAHHRENGLDNPMYRPYSSSNSSGGDERRRTSTDPKATRANPGGAGGGARRQVNDRASVGTR